MFNLSPRHTSEDFKDGMTLDDKIEIFIARIEGWQLGVAQEMVDKKIAGRGLALLHILFSYFEMIAKYQDGFTEEGKSKYYFGKGVRETFPDIPLDEQEFLQNLYTSVRNGLFHAGLPRSNVMLYHDTPGSLGHMPGKNFLAINPDILVKDLQIRFSEYASQLRDKSNIELRSKFEARFDYHDEGF
jgi:hypothetical protein